MSESPQHRSMWSIIADWVGALGSAGALIAAVVLWRIDRKRARAQEVSRNRSELKRLIAGLRVEIEWALSAIERRQSATKRALDADKQAAVLGMERLDRPPAPNSMTVTEAIIFREIASELGKLPSALISDLVGFYELAREIGRLADGSITALEALKIVKGLLPRLRMTGMLLVARLDRFEKSDFAEDADLNVPKEDIISMAKVAGYDLEETLRQRGLALSEASDRVTSATDKESAPPG